MRLLSLLVLSVLILSPSTTRSDDAIGIGPLRTIPVTQLASILPPDTLVLIERIDIEAFLASLEGTPPDWATVYGHGHHDPGHDERLFNLNRERDAAREGNPALNRRVAFVWPGELSRFDPEYKGYAVSIGPRFNTTSWGAVRFKPEDVPSNLRATADKTLAALINRRLVAHDTVEVLVLMVGTLIPTESLIYDFSHDEEGRGVIMPVVRIERVDYLLQQ
jgi:hypothetical protein